jgi:mono/diheme cytochrome c family protein
MTTRSMGSLGLPFFAVLVISTIPSYAANPQHGLDLAKRWCASCHVVSPDQQRASADVPPFGAARVFPSRATSKDA